MALQALEYLDRLDRIAQHSLHTQRIFRDRNDPFDVLDDREFLKRYRFTKNTTRYIIAQVEQDGKLVRYTKRHFSVPVHFQVLVALRLYATGTFQIVIGDTLNIHQSSVSRIVKNVSIALAKQHSHYIRMPTGPKVRENMENFFRMAEFPNVLGAIDCTHIPISNPGGDQGARFVNRKGWHSINTQVVCDSRMQIINIVARWYGSVHDSRIFNECCLKVQMEAGHHQGYLLGDPGYALSHYLMTPIQSPRSDAERKYNNSQRRTRNIIERLFGVWKRRFPILRNGLRTKLSTSLTIIVAVAILHNIAVEQGEPEIEDEEPPTSDDPIEREPVNQTANLRASLVRMRLINEHFQ